MKMVHPFQIITEILRELLNSQFLSPYTEYYYIYFICDFIILNLKKPH